MIDDIERFRRDLAAWVQRKMARLPAFSSAAARLLRGREVDSLPEKGPAEERPREPLSGLRPLPQPPQPALDAHRWVCWPAADNAVHGWGEPFITLPLGTPQSTHSDGAGIQRAVDQNEIAAPTADVGSHRDWRADTSVLVVSWDVAGVYSNGTQVLIGSGILAACVEDPAGSPALLWLESDSIPARIWRQECVIVDDAVTELTGAASWVEISPDPQFVTWAEFSQDAAHLVITRGAEERGHVSEEAAIPAVFSGQSVAPLLVAENGPEMISYTSALEYSAHRKYLLKSQYRSSALSSLWAEVSIAKTILDEELGTIPLEIGAYECFPQCGSIPTSPVGARDPDSKYSQGRTTQDYFAEIEILRDTQRLLLFEAASIEALRESWEMLPGWDTSDGLEFKGEIPPPPGLAHWPCSPDLFGDFCVPDPSAVVTDLFDEDYAYRIAPQLNMDARFDRALILDLGTGGRNHQEDMAPRLRMDVARPAGQSASETIYEDFGHLEYPDWAPADEAELRADMEEFLRLVCPHDLDVRSSGGAFEAYSLDITATQALVSCYGRGILPDRRYVNFLEGGNVNAILSIAGEPNPRIFQENNNRTLSLMKSL